MERWEEDQKQKGRGGAADRICREEMCSRALELERDVVALRRSARKGKGCAEAATILSPRPTTSEAQMSPHFLLRFLRFSDVKVRSNAECCI